MSIIASSDWPDEYPDLLSTLIDLLSSSSTNSVHGAMRVFTEFIKSEVTDDQILPVLRHLLPVLLAILGSTEVWRLISVVVVVCHTSNTVSSSAHSVDEISCGFRVQPVRHGALYGERSTSPSGQGRHGVCPSRVVGSISDSAEC